MPRTNDNNLRCTVPGCKTVIYALTGLQELQKLQQHMKRKHAVGMDIAEALRYRVYSEKKEVPRESE